MASLAISTRSWMRAALLLVGLGAVSAFRATLVARGAVPAVRTSPLCSPLCSANDVAADGGSSEEALIRLSEIDESFRASCELGLKERNIERILEGKPKYENIGEPTALSPNLPVGPSL